MCGRKIHGPEMSSWNRCLTRRENVFEKKYVQQFYKCRGNKYTGKTNQVSSRAK